MPDDLVDSWTVKQDHSPTTTPSGFDRAQDQHGQTVFFIRGEELELDRDQTTSIDAPSGVTYTLLHLSNDAGGGFVPYNAADPNDIRSIAIPFEPGAITILEPSLFTNDVTLKRFAEAAVRKAIFFKTNPAYLLAWAHTESGSLWPDDMVNSPAAQDGEIGVGTYKFRPNDWQKMIDAWGEDQLIRTLDEMSAPLAQQTFAAAHSGDAVAKLTEELGRTPKFYELYMTHLFAIEGAISIIEAGEDDENAPIGPLVAAVFEGDDHSDAILADLNSRKPDLFKDGATFADMKTALIADLDAGFAWVGELVDELFPAPAEKAGDDFTAGTGDSGELGILSEEFESRGDPGAIGKDSTGGYSYGKYQIASKKSMAAFLSSVRNKYPDISKALEDAGGLAAALAGTHQFKAAWKELVSNPNFVPAQRNFIKETHYDVLVDNLSDVINVDNRGYALKNVVWSVAVQHGPYSDVVKDAIQPVGSKTDKQLINEIYDERDDVERHFRSSKPHIQESVAKRFKKERQMALEMLARETA